jgi:hypothetical protein
MIRAAGTAGYTSRRGRPFDTIVAGRYAPRRGGPRSRLRRSGAGACETPAEAIDQKLVPELQLLTSRINNAEIAMLITIEPRHPNRFEKKKNT